MLFRRNKKFLVSASLLAVSAILLVTCTNIPLGIPGDWTWERIDQIDFPLFEIISIIVAIAFAITIFCLFLSSFSRGEMGRLLLDLLPFNTLVAATAIQRICKVKSNYFIVLGLVLLSVFQLLVVRICLRTVLIF